MTIKVVLDSLRIQYSMTPRSTLALVTTFSISSYFSMREMALEYVQIDQWVVDLLTKPQAKGKLETFRERLGLVEKTFLTKREC